MKPEIRHVLVFAMNLQEAKNQLNLKVLQRFDSSITEIVNTTSHVVLYEFTTQWKKTTTEGTLFLVKGDTFKLIVLNRLNLENYVIELKNIKEFQELQDYLIYSYNNAIYGLWIFGLPERKSLFDAINNSMVFKFSLDEIWKALETMGPFDSILNEVEFMNRFDVLTKV